MALDHYVPQVHLRQFNSPALQGKKLYGIRKRDLFVFPCSSKDVCRVEEGSTNPYLAEARGIEEFLKTVEPFYTRALNVLGSGRTDQRSVYTMAGFIAYVATCSPTAIRLQTKPLEGSVDLTAELLERHGELPPPPDVLGARSLTELRQSGAMQLTIDRKFPQALGISNVLRLVEALGNSDWEVLLNPETDHNPFLTSDFPACLEQSPDPRTMDRVVPLAPDIAVRIHPSLDADGGGSGMAFPRHRFRVRRLRRNQVRSINALIAHCAEELIFSRDEASWLPTFLRKHREYRVESLLDRISVGPRHFLIWRTRCVPYRRGPPQRLAQSG